RRLFRCRQPGAAAARRLRLSVGIRHREDRARSARASDPRRNERDYAPHRSAKPRRAMSGVIVQRSLQDNLESGVQHGDLVVREQGALRHITLNRPKALNALTLDMAVTMTTLLRGWAADPAVGPVLLDGAGERGLCAGGDIRALYDAAKSGDTLPEKFWAM